MTDGGPSSASASFTVRAASPSDAAAIQAIYAPFVTDTVASFEQSAPDEAEITRRMVARPRMPWFVAATEGTVVGYAYGSQHRARAAYRWSADCSVYIAPGYHGVGVGRLLYGNLLPAMTALGYLSLFAGIALPNEASVRLHESLGFEPVGVFRSVGHKHRAWHDVGWWQLCPTTLPGTPAEPREWSP